MTGNPDTTAAITDARALLAALLASDWKELYVVTPTREIFIARNGARANPMRALAASVGVQASTDLPVSETVRAVVRAPHVATLAGVAADGSMVARGGALARLSVLDEEITLTAPSDCVIERAEAAIGALLEFDQPVLSTHEAALRAG